jgi:uncharacterized membrane protein YphA (DoxX/SURF4 family)
VILRSVVAGSQDHGWGEGHTAGSSPTTPDTSSCTASNETAQFTIFVLGEPAVVAALVSMLVQLGGGIGLAVGLVPAPVSGIAVIALIDVVFTRPRRRPGWGSRPHRS